ncbi:MAG TPA: SPOR domain-containing protein [Thermoanaerobaculia bacterium]|nr:SPOR domain-containing protein [Thermoanaerobaculia bacterium]
MSTSPPGGEGRGGARRILPSVSEVAGALGQIVPADSATLYRVAREVVVEELARVKQGLESAPLDALVARAQSRLKTATREPSRATDQPDLFGEAPPERPRRSEPPPEPPMPVLPALYEAPEAPFSAASSAELGWDRPGGESSGAVLSMPEPPVAPPLPPERPRSGDELTLPVETVPEDSEPATRPAETADVEMRELDEELVAAEPGDEAARRRLWLLAVAAFAVLAAGVVWIVLKLLSPAAGIVRNETPKKIDVPAAPVLPSESAPTAVAAPAPTPVPTHAPAPTIAPPKKPPTKPAVAKPSAAKPAAPSAGGPVAVFTTADWAGRPPVYIVHFSSHQDRVTAAGEAARLGASLGRPAHAVAVDLGAKGVWYRVVVGEFRSADEARAFRAALAARNTPGMGFVYEMKGPR